MLENRWEIFSRGQQRTYSPSNSNGSALCVLYLVLFEEAPFFTRGRLGTLAVGPSLDGVSHGGHLETWVKCDTEQKGLYGNNPTIYQFLIKERTELQIVELVSGEESFISASDCGVEAFLWLRKENPHIGEREFPPSLPTSGATSSRNQFTSSVIPIILPI